jgi:alkanesulfonate monooxygenase SsuD/methylene tetrahydromethanopterin reductase-like flavin-dependent oxidoreductase (luciferase family)
MVAEEAATMDLLSGGRYVLGAGLGYREAEFTAFGIPMGERAPRLTEQIALMRRLWTEERITHRGRFYAVEDASLSCRPVTPGGRRSMSRRRWRRRYGAQPESVTHGSSSTPRTSARWRHR